MRWEQGRSFPKFRVSALLVLSLKLLSSEDLARGTPNVSDVLVMISISGLIASMVRTMLVSAKIGNGFDWGSLYRYASSLSKYYGTEGSPGEILSRALVQLRDQEAYVDHEFRRRQVSAANGRERGTYEKVSNVIEEDSE